MIGSTFVPHKHEELECQEAVPPTPVSLTKGLIGTKPSPTILRNTCWVHGRFAFHLSKFIRYVQGFYSDVIIRSVVLAANQMKPHQNPWWQTFEVSVAPLYAVSFSKLFSDTLPSLFLRSILKLATLMKLHLQIWMKIVPRSPEYWSSKSCSVHRYRSEWRPAQPLRSRGRTVPSH